MRSVSLQELKERPTDCIERVAAGETILVTDRDRVVAEIVPPRSARTFDELVRAGWLKPAVVASAEPPPRLPVARLHELIRTLDSDRDER